MNERICGECEVCCEEAVVEGKDWRKPANTKCRYQLDGKDCKHGCAIFGKEGRPECCSQYQCSWLRGYGEEEDRPDKSGISISINNLNNGFWIFARERKENALRTTGKNIVLDIARNVDLPVIVSDFHCKPPHDYGDYVVIKKSLKERSKKLTKEFIGYLDDNEEFEIYILNIS